MGGWRYNSIFFTSALDGGEWSASSPCQMITLDEDNIKIDLIETVLDGLDLGSEKRPIEGSY
jgi:hypothetical protein